MARGKVLKNGITGRMTGTYSLVFHRQEALADYLKSQGKPAEPADIKKLANDLLGFVVDNPTLLRMVLDSMSGKEDTLIF